MTVYFFLRPELKPVEKEIDVVLRFPETEPLSPPILQLNEVGFYYAKDKVIFTNVNLGATFESRICIVSIPYSIFFCVKFKKWFHHHHHLPLTFTTDYPLPIVATAFRDPNEVVCPPCRGSPNTASFSPWPPSRSPSVAMYQNHCHFNLLILSAMSVTLFFRFPYLWYSFSMVF